ncbi:GIY-YIG nuclease family protein [Candidatus Ferrigenium straubiae]|jgi:hypothetical protein|uniref:GIY-YIG nuclease family protein n=1 Tax=Candidatus Ferrigenium straubiae TaxID=2919506 RepID=UPI003F4AAB9A
MSNPRDEKYGTVYFLSHGTSGPVKIGFTSGGNPLSRIRQLQTGAPEELNLLGSIAAEASIEPVIHTFLNVHNVRGEWFEREPSLYLLERLQLRSTFYDGEFVRNFGFVEASRPKNDADCGAELLEEQVANNLLWDIKNQLCQVNTELPLPFFAWLSAQMGRDDPIGDLAKEFATNSGMPICGSLKQYLEHFRNVRNPAITRTVIEAWIECDIAVFALAFHDK